jgi:hypothetical protein
MTPKALAVKPPVIPAYIQQSVLWCLSQMPSILFPRNRAVEKFYMDMALVNLWMASTIGTREMASWLRYGRMNGKLYEIGRYQVVTGTFKPSLPGVSELRESTKALIRASDSLDSHVMLAANVSSTTPESQWEFKGTAQQILSHAGLINWNISRLKSGDAFYHAQIIDAAYNQPIDCSGQGLPLGWGCACIELYCKINQLSYAEAVETLMKSFELCSGELEQPQTYGRAHWCQSNEFLRQPYPIFVDNGFIWLSFFDKKGKFAQEVHRFLLGDGTQIVLPLTAWMRRDQQHVLPHNVPSANRFELWNQAALATYPQASVLLTENVGLAVSLGSQNGVWPSVVTSTWYGGGAAIENHLDFSPLQGRIVDYILLEQQDVSQGLNMAIDNARITAARIHDKLTSLGATVSVWDFALKPDGTRGNGEFVARDKLPNVVDVSSKAAPAKSEDDGQPKPLGDLDDVPEQADLLIDPVLAANTVNLMYATAGSCKTWIALRIAAAAACGGRVLDGWMVKKPCRVLYVDSEMTESVIEARAKKIARDFKEPGQREMIEKNFSHMSLAKRGDLSKEDDDGRKAIVRYLEKVRKDSDYHERVDLLILDNLLSMVPNSDGMWDDLYAWLWDLKLKGTSSLVLMHAHDDGTLRGNQQKRNAADTAFLLRKESRDDEDFRIVSIEVTKARHVFGKGIRPVTVRFYPDALDQKWQVLGIDAEDQILKKRIQEMMAESPAPTNDEMAARLGMSPDAFKKLKSRLGLVRDYDSSGKKAETSAASAKVAGNVPATARSSKRARSKKDKQA